MFKESDHIYCIQHTASTTKAVYKVGAYVDIVGNKATGYTSKGTKTKISNENLVLAYIFRKTILVYTLNIALCIINMVPVYPLDGYNILKTILANYKTREKILYCTQKIFFIMVIIIGAIQLTIYANPSIIRFKNSISWNNQTSKNSILVLIRF